jgi:hypothetical protein
VSDDDERASAETRSDDLLEGFDAFRARGAGTPQPPEPEPFPEEYAEYGEYATAQSAMPTVINPVVEPVFEPVPAPGPDLESPTLPVAAASFSAAAEYTAVPPPPPFDPGAGVGAAYIPGGPPPRRNRTRTGFIVAAAAAIVIGLCAGAYSVVVRTDRSSNSSAPPAASTSGSASPQADDAESSKAITVLVVVDSLTADGFTATGESGADISFTLQYTANTKFGTATRPLTHAQVVPGAHVWVRGRRTGYDTITATVVAGVLSSQAAAKTSYAGV